MLKIIIGSLGFIVLISLLWRVLSHRYVLPCPSWLAWLVELDNPFTKVNRAAAIIEHLDLQPGFHVVDVGCGPGRVTIPVAKAVGSSGTVTALDIQQDMLRRVQEKANVAQLSNIEYMHAAVGENKLSIEMYDRALLVTVLGEIPQKEAALQEIYNALKPGGILSITEIIFDPHFQSRRSVLHLAQKIGFKEKAFFGNRLAYTMYLEKEPGQ